MKVLSTIFVIFLIIESICAHHNHNSNESHDSHNSHDSNDSNESHDSHNSHDSNNSNESHDSHNSHDSNDSHEDNHSHGSHENHHSHESHEDEKYKPSAKCLYGQISAEKCCALFPKDLKVSLQHPLNCNQYFKCRKGHPELKNCPKGLHWSVKKQKCLKPQDAKCIVSWRPTTTERPEFPKGCYDGLVDAEYCCSLSSSWFKYLPDPQNCHKFYKCVSGHPVHISCPHGLNWSIKYRKCVYRQFADCFTSSTITTTENIPTTPTESSIHSSSIGTTIEVTSNTPEFSTTKIETSNTTPQSVTTESTVSVTESSSTTLDPKTVTDSDQTIEVTSELTTKKITTTEETTISTEPYTTSTEIQSKLPSDVTDTSTESYTTSTETQSKSSPDITETTPGTEIITDQTPEITDTTSWSPTNSNSITTSNAGDSTTLSSGNEGPCSIVSLDCRHGRISADECCKGVPYWQDVLLQNNNNCGTYFQCVHEKPMIKECPGGLKWNADVCRCEWPSISTCNL